MSTPTNEGRGTVITHGPWTTTPSSRVVIELEGVAHLDVKEGEHWVTVVDGYVLPDNSTRFVLRYEGNVTAVDGGSTDGGDEPAAEFFKPGRDYVENKPFRAPELIRTFRCTHVAAVPDGSELMAMGFGRQGPHGPWRPVCFESGAATVYTDDADWVEKVDDPGE